MFLFLFLDVNCRELFVNVFFLTANFATPEGVMSTAEINQIQRIILRTMVSDLVELSYAG